MFGLSGWQRHQVRRRFRDGDPGLHAEIAPDVYQLAWLEHPPAGFPVEFLGGDDDRGGVGQGGHARAPRTSRCGRAGLRPPGGSKMCRACCRVRQRPQLAGAATMMFSAETGRCRLIQRAVAVIGGRVTAVRVGLLGDQRGVPLESVSPGSGPRTGPAPPPAGERAEASVVGHHAAFHPERAGVTHRPSARRRPPDVRHEAEESACRAARWNSRSRKAASGCLSSTTRPSGRNSPARPRPRWWLCASSESGASNSQTSP